MLSRVVPQSRSVVVSVFPESEGNGLEVARALLERYDGTVVWLRERRTGPARRDRAGRPGHGAGFRRRAWRGLWAYLRAEAVFFTHGLYGSPRPCGASRS